MSLYKPTTIFYAHTQIYVILTAARSVHSDWHTVVRLSFPSLANSSLQNRVYIEKCETVRGTAVDVSDPAASSLREHARGPRGSPVELLIVTDSPASDAGIHSEFSHVLSCGFVRASPAYTRVTTVRMPSLSLALRALQTSFCCFNFLRCSFCGLSLAVPRCATWFAYLSHSPYAARSQKLQHFQTIAFVLLLDLTVAGIFVHKHRRV